MSAKVVQIKIYDDVITYVVQIKIHDDVITYVTVDEDDIYQNYCTRFEENSALALTIDLLSRLILTQIYYNKSGYTILPTSDAGVSLDE